MTTQSNNALTWVLWSVVACTVAVRLAVLDPQTLHTDEALYSAYSLYIARTGDLFLTHWNGFTPDKHPLFFWAVALAIKVFGSSDLAFRLINIGADALSAALVVSIAAQCGGIAAGLFAGCLYAISTLGAFYGATVFIDPFSIALGLLGLALVYSRRTTAAGILLGLSVTTKLFGAIYIPVALVIAFHRGGISAIINLATTCFGVIVMMLGLPILLNTFSDSSSFINEGMKNQNFGISSPEEWLSRVSHLFKLAGFLFESPTSLILFFAGIISAAIGVRKMTAELRDLLLSIGFVSLLYVGGLIIISSPVYDRYFLYLLPILSIAAGIGAANIARKIHIVTVRRAAITIVALALLMGGFQSIKKLSDGDPWIGSRSASAIYGGYVQLCYWLRHNSGDLRVWNHSLSWHLYYCLQGSAAQPAWFPGAKVVTNYREPALLALSKLDDPRIVEDIREDGWTVELLSEFGGMRGIDLWLYQIRPGNN
ncbi:MAG: glycosyltransferase family 39 protein [Methylococcales bacterium]|nr:glycosyltransferase family 39 protein [Methylococcales bacterium]